MREWILGFCWVLVSAQAVADTLLDQMAGTWVGAGERVQLATGNTTRISARTTATLRDGVLFSHNEIAEAEMTYVRDYWIRPAADLSYELGAGEKVMSRGRFDGAVFEVEQDLGAYRVLSRTRFDSQGSVYEQSDWYEDRELSRTRIRYSR